MHVSSFLFKNKSVSKLQKMLLIFNFFNLLRCRNYNKKLSAITLSRQPRKWFTIRGHGDTNNALPKQNFTVSGMTDISRSNSYFNLAPLRAPIFFGLPTNIAINRASFTKTSGRNPNDFWNQRVLPVSFCVVFFFKNDNYSLLRRFRFVFLFFILVCFFYVYNRTKIWTLLFMKLLKHRNLTFSPIFQVQHVKVSSTSS